MVTVCVQVNGEQTLGENIADNGGVYAAFQAYKDVMNQTGENRQSTIDGHTLDQLFFVAFAQVAHHISVAIAIAIPLNLHDEVFLM